MFGNFEGAGDLADWPPNVPGKPTQVAVYGIFVPAKGKGYELLWTGKFPELEKAMYWGAKKELEVMRTRKYQAASRVLWQHDLSPEQAVEIAHAKMRQQIEGAFNAAEQGFDPASGLGNDPSAPLKPVDYSKVEGIAIDIEAPQGTKLDDFFEPLD
jgi:hypothetical protein